MWTCPKCGEPLQGQFDSCWKCAASAGTPLNHTRSILSRRGWRYFGVGLAFELLLILLVLWLPRDSALWVKTFNFLQYSHLIFLAVGEGIGSGFFAIPFLVVSGALMAVFWALILFGSAELGHRAAVALGVTPKSKRILRYSLLSLCAAVAIGMVIDSVRNKPRPFQSSASVSTVVNGNTAFALDLYQHLKQHPGNLFFSPFSLSTALAITYTGAQGNTATEIAAAAHFDLRQDNLHPAFQQLMDRMADVQRWNRIKLVTANSLWLSSDRRFTQAFFDLVRDSYDAQTRSANFASDPQGVAENINAWISRKTNGRIPAMAQSSRFHEDTRLVLCNTVYFKGKWARQFKPSATKPELFYVSSNRTVTVPMMSQKAVLKMARINNGQLHLLELPYYGRDLSMIILLPQAVEGIGEIENALSTDNLSAWLSLCDRDKPHETFVRLPRFTTSQAFNLIPLLQELGIRSAFDSKAANLGGIDGTNDLYLSFAAHEAFVEVNESGTEAAAVTLFEATTMGMSDAFIVNHPFLYLIRDNATGAILFLGRMVDPTTSPAQPSSNGRSVAGS